MRLLANSARQSRNHRLPTTVNRSSTTVAPSAPLPVMLVSLPCSSLQHDLLLDDHEPNQTVGYIRKGRESVAKSVVDRKSTRLNSSHSQISYAVFCLKKKQT